MKKRKLRMIFLKILIIVALIAVVVYLFFNLAPQFGGKPDEDRISALAVNSIYRDGKFHNVDDVPTMLPKSFGKLMKKQFSKMPGRVPEDTLPAELPGQAMSTDSLTVTWLGHSSLLIRIEGYTILTDPVFGKRSSPVSFAGPKPFVSDPKIGIEDLPEVDMVIISHDHFDHLDYSTIKKIHKNVPLFLVPLGIRDHLERWGVAKDKIIEFDWFNDYRISDSLKLIATPAQHFSGRRKQDNSTLWCSWVILGSKERVFFSGDGGYSPHFVEIGEKYGPFDLTLMECGAYGQFWPYIHMNPEESVQAHQDLKGKQLLPIHWGKFNLAFHPWKEPMERMIKEASRENVNTLTPLRGQTISTDSETRHWWEGIK